MLINYWPEQDQQDSNTEWQDQKTFLVLQI